MANDDKCPECDSVRFSERSGQHDYFQCGRRVGDRLDTFGCLIRQRNLLRSDVVRLTAERDDLSETIENVREILGSKVDGSDRVETVDVIAREVMDHFAEARSVVANLKRERDASHAEVKWLRMAMEPPGDDLRNRRYERLAILLDEWAADESGFDERVTALLNAAIVRTLTPTAGHARKDLPDLIAALRTMKYRHDQLLASIQRHPAIPLIADHLDAPAG